MHSTEIKNISIEVLELKYKYTDLSLFVLMPTRPYDSVEDMEKILSIKDWKTIINRTDEARGQLYPNAEFQVQVKDIMKSLS